MPADGTPAIVREMSPAGPLLVYGPRSTTYDFGPSHPLTPRRFGPGISLLEAIGAVPGEKNLSNNSQSFPVTFQ